MTTVAYIANEFPSPIEPYVMDEIRELRCRGVRVICCSGKRVALNSLNDGEREFWNETRFFQPISDSEVVRAVRRLAADRKTLRQVLRPVVREISAAPGRRLRSLGHTVMGAALANELAAEHVDHIHAHHGYFASWMALIAARLLGIDFSFTLHGSDLLVRGDLLAAKLNACRFCVTVSDYNRRYLLEKYPSTPPSKVLVQRLGAEVAPIACKVLPMLTPRQSCFCLLAVGRLDRVKDYPFLIEACAVLRNEAVPFLCWIAGEGPERGALERKIRRLHLQDQVMLLGHVPHVELAGYYRHADLVVMTSRSEGLPVVLMEAMAHRKLVLAPAITGIPELVDNRRTGFLYPSGSLSEFVNSVMWILEHKHWLVEVEREAARTIARSYNRQTNVRRFANQFLARIGSRGPVDESSLLQQVQLSV